MAAETGLSTSTSRIWRAFGLKPHLVETFKLSNDPFFIEKVRDVVGLYLNPPERAVVLRVTRNPHPGPQPILPLLPMMPVAERRSFDYARPAPPTCSPPSRGHRLGHPLHPAAAPRLEFNKFLNQIDHTIPDDSTST